MNEELSKSLEALFAQYGRKLVKDTLDRVEATMYSADINREWLKIFAEREDANDPFVVDVKSRMTEQMESQQWIDAVPVARGKWQIHVTEIGRSELTTA